MVTERGDCHTVQGPWKEPTVEGLHLGMWLLPGSRRQPGSEHWVLQRKAATSLASLGQAAAGTNVQRGSGAGSSLAGLRWFLLKCQAHSS